MKILVINSGSSSIKYQLFDIEQKQQVIASGLVERIGEANGRIKYKIANGQEIIREDKISDHGAGLKKIVDLLMDDDLGVIQSPSDITAVGHRVVHGGEQFSAPTLITQEVKDTILQLSSLAPLHNPPNLAGIEVAEQIFPDCAQVAVFDTAFHQTMPDYAYRYAIPNELYEHDHIRAYGFHGTSHFYVGTMAYSSPESSRIITLHLGNGASVTAIKDGKSIDTSMGFSPLPGLVMGTRSGDIDPAVVTYLASHKGMSVKEVDKLLNKQSGLLGLTGDNDLRDIEARYADGDKQATLAIEMYCYRIKKYIGAYMAVMGGLDTLVFTAGVGENSDVIRGKVCEGLEGLGIVLDDAKNARGKQGNSITEIQAEDSKVKILIIPTNEELMIAINTYNVVEPDDKINLF